MPHDRCYAVITPARDEIDYIGDLAQSLFAQTIPFSVWVVVDDGSTDGTQELVRGLAERDSRIALVVRDERAERLAGTGDIEAANVGLASLPDPLPYGFIAKLDADLVLPPDYFELLFDRFDADARLGIAGGHIYNRTPRGLEFDKVPDDHVHGATKLYRAACLRSIWPLREVWGWDTVDECTAQMKGWRTHSFLEASVIHQKPMTGCVGSPLRGKFFLGRSCYFLGYRWDYLLVRAARHLGLRPYVTGGFAMAAGYLLSALQRADRIDDDAFRRYLRSRQADKLRRTAMFWRRSEGERSVAG